MVLSVFRMLHDHRHYLFSGLFPHPPHWNSVLIKHEVPTFPPPPSPWGQHSPFCFCEFAYSRELTQVESHNISTCNSGSSHLCTMFSRSFYGLTCINFTPFYGRMLFHCMHTPRVFIHSSVEGHVGCFLFWLLGIRLLWTSSAHLEVGLLDRVVILCLTFQGTSIQFLAVAAPPYVPAGNVPGVQFLSILVKPVIFNFWVFTFLIIVILCEGCEVVATVVFLFFSENGKGFFSLLIPTCFIIF